MRMRFFLIALTFCLAFSPAAKPLARMETIAAVVNEDAISMSDVEDRMKLILVSSGLPDTADIRSKVMPQAMNTLIEEQLKLQEARRLELSVSQDEISQGFATIAQQNKFTPEQFRTVLNQSGINIATIEQQIEAQISWSKVVQKQIRPKINISDSDIDEVLERISVNKGMTEYNLAEIFLPIEDPKNEGDTGNLAEKLMKEIKSGKAPFGKIAQQFSKAPGAAQGGSLGWVQQGQLPQELDAALQTMQPGDLSQPVRTASGYHLLMLREIRQITHESAPSREQILSNLGTERLERMQRRYYLDLKAGAFIENRVSS